MPKFSHKNKIYVSLAIWFVVTFIIFWYGFPVIESGTLAADGQVLAKAKQYQDLQQQQASFQAGKKDLETLAKKPYQPSDFFSKDTSVVKEIETLETLAKSQNLELDLQVTGTKASASKAPTSSDIVQIPYTIALTGSYSNLVSFLQTFENLSFITHAQGLDIAALKEGQIKATLSAIFFVQK